LHTQAVRNCLQVAGEIQVLQVSRFSGGIF
jgi:hypothetical protein